ncbi:MAG TPA: cupin domain-containing protein [Candidatus Binataceae bacterium]|nr:cupin domain-containing protein [Candidatus Binataceae bacterium]
MATAHKLAPPAIDPASVPESKGVTQYPEPFRALVAGRARRVLGTALGLTHFGVNLTRLDPGAHSSARHWHALEDEFIYVLEGEVTLITDEGEQTLTPGTAAGFPAGKPNAHHLVNRGNAIATYLEIGDRRPGDEVSYPEIDLAMRWTRAFTHQDGRPY